MFWKLFLYPFPARAGNLKIRKHKQHAAILDFGRASVAGSTIRRAGCSLSARRLPITKNSFRAVVYRKKIHHTASSIGSMNGTEYFITNPMKLGVLTC
jgi:hypothetical protein